MRNLLKLLGIGSKRYVNSDQLGNQYFSNALRIENAEQGQKFRVVPIGSFPEHPDGPHEITTADIQAMERNLKNSGADIMFDFGHESLFNPGAEAAGWSPKESAEARQDGLYIDYPQFSNDVTEKINARKYRYFSPVYFLNYRDKQGNEIGAKLDSIGLTNRPYLDREIEHIRNANTKEKKMFTKEMKEKLGLPEDATDEQVNEKLDALAQIQTADKSMKEKLGLPEDATDEQVNTKLDEVLKEKEEEGETADVAANSEVLKRIETLEKANQKNHESAAENLINAAIADGKILPADKDVWLNNAKNYFDATKETLNKRKKNSAMPNNVQVSNDDPNKGKKNSLEAAAEYFRQQGRQPLAAQQN